MIGRIISALRLISAIVFAFVLFWASRTGAETITLSCGPNRTYTIDLSKRTENGPFIAGSISFRLWQAAWQRNVPSYPFG
jgi:hypothetical protein